VNADDARNFLVNGYKAAGQDFLAVRLDRVFKILMTPEDVARHNDVMSDILAMVEEEESDKANMGFLRNAAQVILLAGRRRIAVLKGIGRAIIRHSKLKDV